MMIDTVHEHECLIFLLAFNVLFISSLTYVYSYILAVWWYVLCVDFMRPKPYFYICVISIASIISLYTMYRTHSARQHGVLSEKTVNIH